MPDTLIRERFDYIGFVKLNVKGIPKTLIKGTERVLPLDTYVFGELQKEYDHMWNSVYYRKDLAKYMDRIFGPKDANYALLKSNKKEMGEVSTDDY